MSKMTIRLHEYVKYGMKARPGLTWEIYVACGKQQVIFDNTYVIREALWNEVDHETILFVGLKDDLFVYDTVSHFSFWQNNMSFW